jgi:predicted ATPase
MIASLAHRSSRALPGERWSVQLLGGLRARHGDIEVTNFGGRLAVLLLARLLLQSAHAHSRDTLAEWLWPTLRQSDGRTDDERQTRRDRLKRELYKLNRALSLPGLPGGAPFLADRHTLRVNTEAIECDALAFERHVRRSDISAAHTLYQGPLLPGFDEEWIEDQRIHFEGLREKLIQVTNAGATNRPGSAPFDSHLAHEAGLIGRRAELAHLLDLLVDHRLVVVTGVAGCGKTRLCSRVVHQFTGADITAIVRLRQCTDAAEMGNYVRAALGLSLDSLAPHRGEADDALRGTAWAQVLAHLKGRRALLLLDDIGHLVGKTSEAALESLLLRLPGLRLLVTSRSALRANSARNVLLKSLPVPAIDTSLAAAAGNPAVALFVDRARTASADFALNQRNLPGVIGIVRTLHGLPLALEIAASRLRLRGEDSAGASERPRPTPHSLGLALRRVQAQANRDKNRLSALDNVLIGSWSLMSHVQQSGLMDLTVFRGGWTAAQAQAVLGKGDADGLLRLLEQDSLVRLEANGAASLRYQMIESLRTFAVARMQRRACVGARSRHREVFVALANSVASRASVLDSGDLPNFLSAMVSALGDGVPEQAATIALSLQLHWTSGSASAEALAVLRRVVSCLPQATIMWPALARLVANLLVTAGHGKEASALAEHALATAGAEPMRQAEAQLAVTEVRWLLARDGAATWSAAQAVDKLARRHGFKALQARAQLLLGASSISMPARAGKATGYFAQAQRLFYELDDPQGELRALAGRSACLIAAGKHRAAVKLSTLGEQLAEKQSDINAQLQFCSRLSTSWDALAQPARALQVCRRHTKLAWSQGLVYHLAYGIWNQCEPLAHLGQLERAARLMAFSKQYWVARFDALDAADQAYVDAVMRLVSDGLGAALSAELWQQGLALDETQAVGLAIQ